MYQHIFLIFKYLLRFSYTFLGLVLFLMLSERLSAQITTGGLKGRVGSGTDGALAGVKVELVNEEIGAKYTTVTDNKGNFVFYNLEPGSHYAITAFSNMGTVEKKDIVIKLGENASIDLNGHKEVVLENVVITGSKIFNRNKTGIATQIDTRTIMQIPTFTRSITDITKLTPQANGLSLGGANTRFNNITIDGAISNDAFALCSTDGLPGGSTHTQPISLDAIKEMQIVLSPYSVQYGNFTGGSVNAITRSGSNKVRGSAYLFVKNAAFTGKDPITRKATADFSEYTTGMRVGGPIIKNKLFYFVNYEFVRRTQPSLFNLGESSTALSKDSAELIAQTMKEKYGYDVGTAGPVNLITQNHKGLIKLDYNINNKNKISIRYSFVVAYLEKLSRSHNVFYFGNGMSTYFNKQNVAVIQLRSTIHNNLYNNLILSYSSIRDTREPKGQYFPLIYTAGGSSGTVVIGSDNFAQDNRVNQDIIELTDNVNYTVNNYTFTFGTHNELFFFYNSFIPRKNGLWQYNSVKEILEGNNPTRFRAAFPVVPNGEISKFGALQLSLYAQVEASYFQNRLKFSLGIRGDLPVFLDKPLDNPAFTKQYGYRTNVMPQQFLYSPRFGFIWDMDREKTVIMRGGVGIFTGRVPFVWMNNNFANDGIRLANVDTQNFNKNFDPNINNIPSLVPAVSHAVNVVDTKLKFPQILRANYAFDFQLSKGFFLTFEGIFTKTLNNMLVKRLDVRKDKESSVPSVPNMTFEKWKLNDEVLNVAGEKDPSKSYSGGVYLLTNTNKGYAYNATAKLTKDFNFYKGGRLSIMGAYTYSRVFDVNSNVSCLASTNFTSNNVPAHIFFNNPPLSTSAFEMRHIVIATLAYRVAYAKNFSTVLFFFFRSNSGHPYSLVYSARGDVNGDGQRGNDLVYIPTSEEIQQSKLTLTQKETLTNFVNQPVFRKYQGKFSERNMLRTPWENVLDMRILQNFIAHIVGKPHTFQLSLEIFNLTNLFNTNWGRVYSTTNAQIVSNTNGSILTKRNGEPFTLQDTYSVSFDSRWQIQLGFRYLF